MANEVNILNSDRFINPEEENTGLIGKASAGALGVYGAKHGLKHLTPITYKAAKPLMKASTTIKGYYDAGVTPFQKIGLLTEHWKKSDLPAVTEYLEKYKNTPDPWGYTYKGGATQDNIKALRQGIKYKGGAFGLPGGIETADEFQYAARLHNAEKSIRTAELSGDENLLKSTKKIARDAKNQLRYEMQKTELIKHSFGQPINQTRWSQSGLGQLIHTDVKTALQGNSRAIRQWGKAGLHPDSKVTASILEKDTRGLIRSAKNYGQSFMPNILSMGNDKYIKKTYGKYGMKDIADRAFQLYERGYTRNQVNSFIFRLIGNSNNAKTKEMLKQFMDFHDFVDGKLKVNYAFVSNQKAIAGVNADLEIWRGKGASKSGKTRVKGMTQLTGSQYKGTPGKLYHKILVSDVYDVAGGAGSITQKNIHINVAQGGNFGKAKPELSRVPIRSKLYKALINKDTKKLSKLLPRASKKTILRLARFALLKR